MSSYGLLYFTTSMALYLSHHLRRSGATRLITSETIKKTVCRNDIANLIGRIEELVQRDEGQRGIGPIIQPAGELLRACEAIHQAKSVAIITGFPCLLAYTPPTETDGPLGALAIAKALLALDKEVTVLTDECNEEVLLACSAATRIDYKSRFSMQSFPPEKDFDDKDWVRLYQVADSVDLIIAIERAGRNKDDRYLTMRCKDMTDIVAPLDYLITLQSPTREQKMASIGIGDGGNEVGMGKAYEAILNSGILNAIEIACVVPADHLLVSSVSNWGGYALSAASILYSSFVNSNSPEVSVDYLRSQLNAHLPSDEEETNKCVRIVEAGARDGITSEQALKVDGMDLQVSLDLIQKLRQML
eukprot:gene33334-40323_t